MQDRPTFGVFSNQGLSHLCSVANTAENFSETKFRKKKSKFLVYGKTPIIQFSYMKNAYHRVFIQFSVRMELYEIVWQEVSHIWKLYDKKFWSTRALNKFSIICPKNCHEMSLKGLIACFFILATQLEPSLSQLESNLTVKWSKKKFCGVTIILRSSLRT